MLFVIEHYEDEDVVDNGEVIIPGISTWQWRLESNDGEVICRAGKSWDSEKACRSQLAKAKVSMKGARFAKVVVSDVP